MEKNKLLEQLKNDFYGLGIKHQLANGKLAKRHYMDSGASCLMMKTAHHVGVKFLDHYSNTHSMLHFSAKTATEVYKWAHQRILNFFNLPEDNYTCIFIGSGSTAGFNRIAKGLSNLRPDKHTVLVSLMEHHSNDLPHRKHHKHTIHIPCIGQGSKIGHLCLQKLESLLKENNQQVNYVAVTGASNVTGIKNPIHKIADLAHKYDAKIVVDGSQMVAHAPVSLINEFNPGASIDAFIFSGHKVYVPGSPGVMLVRKDLLQKIEPSEMGGGMVSKVFKNGYDVLNCFPDREEAGTPNIYGAVMLACALDTLDRVGMDYIAVEENMLLTSLFNGLMEIDEVKIYGNLELKTHPRLPTISFNIKNIDHGLVAAVLNDYFNIAVRNECFCAHPYVRAMIIEELWDIDLDDESDMANNYDIVNQGLGMVRVSLGLYNTENDINALLDSIKNIISNQDLYKSKYYTNADGEYRHKAFINPPLKYFNPSKVIDRYIDDLSYVSNV